MKAFLFFAVVHYHVETAGHRDEELMALFERVACSVSAARHIIQIKYAPDRKRDMPVIFDESQVPARVGNLRQFNDSALVQTHKARLQCAASCACCHSSICLSASFASGMNF